MNIQTICDNIVYVGVNDRTTQKFEGLWPLPYGVSYNAYVVSGSKAIALIDTVKADHTSPHFERIDAYCDKAPDYLVVNHMEPDHSGSIPDVITKFPNIKIIGNRQTIAMIGGYYGITDPERFIEVKDGDAIDLGDLSLTFYLTPMVHWPETMMTYVKERKLLFAGDAFGCFGALNGGVIDSEMETDWYLPEMERYYSNIVGKYGKFVQRALAKLSDLELDYLCSTHGPVWHRRLSEIVDIYDRLSKYEAKEGVTIIYGSMYGHTADMADRLAAELTARGIREIRIHNASVANMSDMIADAFRYKGLIVGSPTYSMHLFPPVEQFMIAMETRELKNRVFGSFGSFTWASAVPKAIEDYVSKMQLTNVGHIDMKQAMTEQTANSISEFADAFVENLRK